MKYIHALLLIATMLMVACKKEKAIPTEEKYFPQVKAVIQHHCLSCHGSSGAWLGRPTAFDTDEEIVTAAASIKAAVADPATPGPFGNRRMPPDTVLAQSDIDVIVKWLAKGGKATD